MKFLSSMGTKDKSEQEFIQVSGTPVKIVPYLKTYTYQKTHHQWFVVEETTGLAIGRGISKSAAITNAKRHTKKRREDDVLAILAKHIKAPTT